MATPLDIDRRPIGIFDSGLGGLSVLREVRSELPVEDVLYVADSAFLPYGIKSPEEIRSRARAVSRCLLDQGTKIIVVACNTASSVAINDLREAFPQVRFVGLEPAVKPAVGLTTTGKIGVLATPRTVAGARLKWLIESHAGGVEVHNVPAPRLVELVESGHLSGSQVQEVLAPLLDPLLKAGIDTIVLGCTHYPFLRQEIETYVGADVAVIDSGTAIARRVRTILVDQNAIRLASEPGTLRLMTSGDPGRVGTLASRLFGEPLTATSICI